MEDLPEETQEFLANLSHKDIQRFRSAIRFYETADSFGRVIKYAFLALTGFAFIIATFGESILKIRVWFH